MPSSGIRGMRSVSKGSGLRGLSKQKGAACDLEWCWSAHPSKDSWDVQGQLKDVRRAPASECSLAAVLGDGFGCDLRRPKLGWGQRRCPATAKGQLRGVQRLHGFAVAAPREQEDSRVRSTAKRHGLCVLCCLAGDLLRPGGRGSPSKDSSAVQGRRSDAQRICVLECTIVVVLAHPRGRSLARHL